MNTIWPDCGFERLHRNAQGWLQVTPAYLRLYLQRPELAPVAESCATELVLHQALLADPERDVADSDIDALQDADARDNYRAFLPFRAALLQAGSIEGCYLALMRAAAGNTPPLFLDLLVQAIVRNLLDGNTDPWLDRAAEFLYRPQRIALRDGRLLAGDRDTLDLLQQHGALGDIGRLLRDSGARLREQQLQVLDRENAAGYWLSTHSHGYVLDLTHETSLELSHGLRLTMARSDSGLKALAGVLEHWLAHLLGLVVRIQPRQKIEDTQWRWHIGLDLDASAILNALYLGEGVDPGRLAQLVSLFQLDFVEPLDMRADLAGRPVYLGLAMDTDGVLRLKPQNLLLNLPLAARS